MILGEINPLLLKIWKLYLIKRQRDGHLTSITQCNNAVSKRNLDPVVTPPC